MLRLRSYGAGLLGSILAAELREGVCGEGEGPSWCEAKGAVVAGSWTSLADVERDMKFALPLP